MVSIIRKLETLIFTTTTAEDKTKQCLFQRSLAPDSSPSLLLRLSANFKKRRRIGNGDRVFVEAAEEIDCTSQEDEAEEDSSLGTLRESLPFMHLFLLIGLRSLFLPTTVVPPPPEIWFQVPPRSYE
ncbi:hypothetical protein Bca4012_026203 [Brassica carinata]